MLLHLYSALTVINTSIRTGGHQNETFNVITNVSIQISMMVNLNQCGAQTFVGCYCRFLALTNTNMRLYSNHKIFLSTENNPGVTL